VLLRLLRKYISCGVQIVGLLVTLLSVPGPYTLRLLVRSVLSDSLHLCSCLNSLEPSGYNMYCTTMFITQKFYVLPTRSIYVFCVDLRTNSDYFSIQH